MNDISTETGQLLHKMETNDILCLEGDADYDLYIIHSGELMVCVTKGSQVIPLAYLNEGQYLGELSFFDGLPRSATVIAIKPTILFRIPPEQIKKQFPNWLRTLAKFMTEQIRMADKVVASKGIKKKLAGAVKPLTIEEQSHYFQLIKSKTHS